MKFDEQWAAIEFADVELQDARLNRRCQELAVALGQQPTASINQACEDWADTKAAYRFFGNTQKVTPAGISAPHQQRTVERMSQHPLVLAVQDTTFFNYTHHPHTEGLGEIGNKKQQQRGFGLHSTLVVTPAGVPLGTLTQQFFTRPIGEPAHTPRELQQLPIEQKESYRWLEAFEQTLQVSPAGVEVVTICDREADIYEMFVLAEEKKASLVIRASANRVLAEREVRKLWAKVEQQPLVGHLTLQITPNQQRQARQATVSVRFTQVKLKPPWRPNQKKLPRVTLNAILVREDHPPAGVDEPIEWLLLTNTSVQNFDDAIRVVGWYGCRWHIEVYHKIIKSGCTVEDCRLEKAERLHNYIALMSVVAWRLHWLTYINRNDPDLPCTVILTATEWQALYMRIHRTTSLPPAPPTVRQAVRWIAQLGGFLGRKRDGEPGITVIWRGWQRLQDMADTWYLVFEERLHVDFAAGKIPGFVHLYAGEEAVAVGVCANLTDADFITSTHRGHGHCIAKGVDIKEMMAEIYGKATGACKGKGGSMHIADVNKGMLGANGIVGGGPPLACGAGLTGKLKGAGQVTVCFFGDGASNQGTTLEGMNLAGIWKLPVIFVCENNRYAETTSPIYSVSGQDIAARARGFGMPSVAMDGQDVFAIYEATWEAVARARRGDGPSFIEAQTYRYYGHFEGDTIRYRDKEEEEHYRSQDCIERFRQSVLAQGLLNEAELNTIDQKARQTIEEAVAFAEKSPLPELAEILTDVYVDFPQTALWPFQVAPA